jgi:serine/threonine protein kinase
MAIGAGSRFGPYELVSLLGAGGMGEVYRAHDPRLRRDVALKVLLSSPVADADRLRRFQQEAQATCQLNHPNILTVYDVGQQDGIPYIVSELLEGETLRSGSRASACLSGGRLSSAFRSRADSLPLTSGASFIAT